MIKLNHHLLLVRPCRFSKTVKGVLFILLLFSSVSLSKKTPVSSVIIQYRVYIHGEPLQLNKKYKNTFGETFEISRFRFYAGRISPLYEDADIKNISSEKYHLIDLSDSNSTKIEIPAADGNCNGISFQVGIDSADQCSGAQTGVLDPARGMFWTWNSGYQSFKIEGYSPQSDQPAHVFAYHIGGYRSPYNTVWKLRLGTTNDEAFLITKEKKVIVEIPIEMGLFFESPTPIHLLENPSCTTPGEMARKISENFIGTFIGLTIIPAT